MLRSWMRYLVHAKSGVGIIWASAWLPHIPSRVPKNLSTVPKILGFFLTYKLHSMSSTWTPDFIAFRLHVHIKEGKKCQQTAILPWEVISDRVWFRPGQFCPKIILFYFILNTESLFRTVSVPPSLVFSFVALYKCVGEVAHVVFSCFHFIIQVRNLWK